MEGYDFKVGDKVLFETGYPYNHRETIREIVKITPTGRVRISGSSLQFGKGGYRLGRGKWSEPCSIRPISDQEIIEWKKNRMKTVVIRNAMQLCHNIKSEDLDYETACKITEWHKRRINHE